MKKFIDFIKKYSTIIFILFITIIGFLLRIKIGLCELANDEIATLVTSTQAFPTGILNALMTKNLHAPLFYFILHFWIKFFGEKTEILRLLPILLGTLCIPLAYLCGKNLHSKSTGLITATLVSVNFFMISYSHFCKFYALLELLGFLSIYFLIKFDTNKLNKKYLYLLAITNIMIIYTYVIGFLFVFIQIFIYLLYRIKIKQDKNIKFTIPYFITLLILTLPITPFMIKVIQNTQSSIFPTFVWYEFNPIHIQTVILSWFSPALHIAFNEGARTDATQSFYSGNYIYLLIFNIIPLCIALAGIIKTLYKKDLCKYILYISLLFVFVELIGAILGKFAFCSRYTILCFPGIILAVGYGLTQVKIKNLAVLLVTIYIYCNILYPNSQVLCFYNTNVSEIFQMSRIMNNLNLKHNDCIIIPMRGYYFQKYYDTSNINFISYDINYTFKINDKKIINTIFDQNDVIKDKKLTNYEKFTNYLDDYKPSNATTQYLKLNCINKLNKGNKVFLITYDTYDSQNLIWYTEAYKDNIYKLLATKLNYDIESILKKNLTQIQTIKAQNFKITEYEKKR